MSALGSWWNRGSASLSLAIWQRPGGTAQIVSWSLKASALVGAALAGRHAYRLFYNRPFAFDDSLPWYGLAFALLVVAAWNRETLALRTWPARAVRYVRAHPVEMAALAGVFGIALFIRLWNYGSLPPAGFLCCEEGINAGVASSIAEGGRPLNYPLVRYSTAFGLWAFGSNTDGLRLPFVLFGIAATVPFYLLMRELVRAPAALFATALFASAHTLGDTSIHFQPGLFASISFAYVLIRGMKTWNPLWWLLAGVLAALLSYEYETFKVVPLFAAVFVGAALLWALIWPPPSEIRVFGSRAWSLVKRAWFPAIIFGLAVAIAITPMLARRNQNENIYFGSLNRQQAGRTATGIEKLLTPRWKDQLKFVGQIYTPFVESTYPRVTSIDANGVIDKATSVLIWAGVVAAALTFWRRWRLLFLMWFVGGSVALALMVQNFAAWKVVGFIPPGLVLVGLLVDDIWDRLRAHRLAVFGLAGGLVVAVAFALGANALILRDNAASAGVQRAYAIPGSELFASCSYLQSQPESSYAHLTQWSLGGWGFAQPRIDARTERVAWRGLAFLCGGLQGRSVASGEEIWPPPAVGAGPTTFALTGRPEDVATWRAALERAMPGLGEPARVVDGPADEFQVVGYEFPAGEASKWRGLSLAYGDRTGRAQERVADPSFILLTDLADDESAQITGLVQVPAAAESGWALVAENAEGSIRIDGTVTFDAAAGERSMTPVALSPGWHVVEAALRPVRPDEPVRLKWQLADGRQVPALSSTFAFLSDTDGWLHTRTLVHESGLEKTVSRFDFEPHMARRELTFPELSRWPPTTSWEFGDDVYTATWNVPASGLYRFEVATPGSEIELRLDDEVLSGEVVTTADGTRFVGRYDAYLAAGEHELQLRFRQIRGHFVGGDLKVTDEGESEVVLSLSPRDPPSR